jgi:hypothetical protein
VQQERKEEGRSEQKEGRLLAAEAEVEEEETEDSTGEKENEYKRHCLPARPAGRQPARPPAASTLSFLFFFRHRL